ncbi:MAG: lysophospholipid acyltransferase family protein [Acidobacteriota bacterium]
MQPYVANISKLASLTRRFLLWFLGLTLGPFVRVEGGERLIRYRDEAAIYVLNHNNSYEVLPMYVFLARHRGLSRMVHFMVDWMFTRAPLVGGLIRLSEPIPVFTKPAKWNMWESWRRAHRHLKPLGSCLKLLAQGRSVGIFPEGTRNPSIDTLKVPRRGLGPLVLRSSALVIPIGLEFPARHRLGRMPSLGRLVIRVGKPVDVSPERDAYAKILQRQDSETRRQRQFEEEQAVTHKVMLHLAPLCSKTYPHSQFASEESDSPGEIMKRPLIETLPVTTDEQRQQAIEVIRAVYKDEKSWIETTENEVTLPGETSRGAGLAGPAEGEGGGTVVWLLTTYNGDPAGVLRVSYDPPMEIPAHMGVELEESIDVEALKKSGRFAELGRFMILPKYRRKIRVAMSLMKGCMKDMVERGYSHALTVVFQDDPHSPLNFHTRVLGFQRIGTHRFGELNTDSLRIILMLDLYSAYANLKHRNNKVFGEICRGLERQLEALAQTFRLV